MKFTDLPSLHSLVTNGYQLQREAVKAINQVLIYQQNSGAVAPHAQKLKDFFAACSDAIVAPGGKIEVKGNNIKVLNKGVVQMIDLAPEPVAEEEEDVVPGMAPEPEKAPEKPAVPPAGPLPPKA